MCVCVCVCVRVCVCVCVCVRERERWEGRVWDGVHECMFACLVVWMYVRA